MQKELNTSEAILYLQQKLNDLYGPNIIQVGPANTILNTDPDKNSSWDVTDEDIAITDHPKIKGDEDMVLWGLYIGRVKGEGWSFQWQPYPSEPHQGLDPLINHISNNFG